MCFFDAGAPAEGARELHEKEEAQTAVGGARPSSSPEKEVQAGENTFSSTDLRMEPHGPRKSAPLVRAHNTL